MPLIFSICNCGNAFTAKSLLRLYCDTCRDERRKQANQRAKKKYLATEKGRENARATARSQYYKFREDRLERAKKYYYEHKEQYAEYDRRKRAQEPKLCKHCKQPFERKERERICPVCCARIEQEKLKKKAQKAQERITLRQEKKKLSRSLSNYHKQIQRLDDKLSNRAQVILSEEERMSMFRAVLARHRENQRPRLVTGSAKSYPV